MSKVTEGPALTADLKIKAEARNLHFYYGNFHALKNIHLDIPERGCSTCHSVVA